jgi:hypothetical protein
MSSTSTNPHVPPAIDLIEDFPCFAVSESSEPITLEHTLEMEDELDLSV